ncbi:MAG TPA: hypothetical protein VGO31_16560 [Microbacteriaceae bacterium]|nr:hypothetical protein [Microbacteriaceae bacterium]
MNRRRFAAILVPAALIASLMTAVAAPDEPASAAVGSQFDPGNIISDGVMYNGSAMTANDVQQFLVSKVPTCRSSYACLMNYGQPTPTMPASAYCATYQGAAGESAATIIAKVGAACNISQKSLIVLLEKEQGLVTSTTPTAGRFASATGFGCPDTAPCDPNVGGFFYQVYYAARQFQIYAAKPLSFNYQAGRNNNILWHPNAACGSSTVFIQNKATAGLYDYTPYRPNAAALANLYGTGDGCSSYGNRNFWRIFTDWFGSPTLATSLLRTVDNGTVYLISGTFKYPVPSIGILTALTPLGQVGYVSQPYLDSFTTGHTVGRSLRGPDGSIYFYDSGIKLPFTSCAQAVDYGASCAPDGYVQLTQVQVDSFYTGPVLGPVLGTVEGSRYYITAGTKREILDDRSQTEAGIPLGYNVLTENAVSALPLGAPIVRDSVFIQTRSTSSYTFLAGGSRYGVNGATGSAVGLPQVAAGALNAASIQMLPDSGKTFTGVVRTAGATASTVLVQGGRYDLTAGAGGSAAVPATPVTQEFINSYPLKGTFAPGSLIKPPDNGTVYVVMPTDIRPIGSWQGLLSLTPPGASPVIATVPGGLISALPQGAVALVAGSLVRSATDATVYLINGVTNRIPFSNFDMPVEAGFKNLTFAPSAQLSAYPTASTSLGFGISCGTKNYIAAGGSLHEVTAALAPLYPFTYMSLDQFACQNTTIGTPATSFIRTADGSIYYLSGGQKLPITSMARLEALGGSVGWLNVVNSFAAAIPTGPLA